MHILRSTLDKRRELSCLGSGVVLLGPGLVRTGRAPAWSVRLLRLLLLAGARATASGRGAGLGRAALDLIVRDYQAYLEKIPLALMI